jgi:hypothetical protein
MRLVLKVQLVVFIISSSWILQTGRAATDNKKDCVKWGGQFDVPLRSKNVRRGCTLPDGRAVCCAAVSLNTTGNIGTRDAGSGADAHRQYLSRGVGYNYIPPENPAIEATGKKYNKDEMMRCEITKRYESSPQELREFEMSVHLQQITDKDKRLDALMKHVTSEDMLRNATLWLQRVTVHMDSENIPEVICNCAFVLLSS